jgi:hypothetical protein
MGTHVVAFLVALLLPALVSAATHTVGPGKTFALPCDALESGTVADGDTIEIDGTDSNGAQLHYVDDFCTFAKRNLIIRGVGVHRPHIRAATTPLLNDQGIWRPTYTYGTVTTLTVENIEMSGAHGGDLNEQPIWTANTNLVLRNVYFHHNDHGVLSFNEGVAGAARMYEWTIENSEFAYNGGAHTTSNSNGNAHNVYIGQLKKVTIIGNYIHDSINGQNIKSRANETYILYNRIADFPADQRILSPTPPILVFTGHANYEIDLSIGCACFVIGNVIYQASGSANKKIVTYHAEIPPVGQENSTEELYFLHNTVVNMASPAASVIAVHTSRVTPYLVMKNNIFAGFASGSSIWATGTTPVTQPVPEDNRVYETVAAANFVDALSQNYHLGGSASAIDAAVPIDPALELELDYDVGLDATHAYVHPRTTAVRVADGAAADMGAYETNATLGTAIPPPILWTTSTASAVILNWTPSLSDVVITGYQIWRNGALLDTVTGALTYSDATTVLGTSYTYQIVATTAGSSSPASNTVSGTLIRQVTGTLAEELGWQEVLTTAFDAVIDPVSTGKYLVFYRPGISLDTQGNRLLLWNNGQTRADNSVYALDFDTLTVAHLNVTDSPLGTADATSGGRPNARQTLSQLAWLPNVNKLHQFGGYRSGAGFVNSTWLFTPPTNTWELKTPTGSIPATTYATTAYDEVTQKVIILTPSCLDRYDPIANAFDRPWPCVALRTGNHNTVIDQTHRRLYVFGPSYGGFFDLNAGGYTALTGSSCLPLMAGHMGLAWDPQNEQVVGWYGGDTIYKLNPTTNTCTPETIAGGPGYATLAEGYTVGRRFQYVPSIGGFVALTDTNKNAFVLRLNHPTPDSNFTSRCTAAGVTTCYSFDEMSGQTKVLNAAGDDVGVNVYPDALGTYRASIDTAVKVSGAGSLKFTLPPPPHGGVNIGGAFTLKPTTTESIAGSGDAFGPSEPFWLQFRVRLSDTFTNNSWSKASRILELFREGSGNTPQVVLSTYYATETLMAYMNGGSTLLYTDADLATHKPTGIPTWIQQGDQNCQYGVYASCFNLLPNEWYTIQFKVTTAVFGSPGHAVEAWYARLGDTAWTKFLNITTGLTITAPSGGFNALSLAPLMPMLLTTEGTPGVSPTMHVDELIVSTAEIALPEEDDEGSGGPTPGTGRRRIGGTRFLGGGSFQ